MTENAFRKSRNARPWPCHEPNSLSWPYPHLPAQPRTPSLDPTSPLLIPSPSLSPISHSNPQPHPLIIFNPMVLLPSSSHAPQSLTIVLFEIQNCDDYPKKIDEKKCSYPKFIQYRKKWSKDIFFSKVFFLEIDGRLFWALPMGLEKNECDKWNHDDFKCLWFFVHGRQNYLNATLKWLNQMRIYIIL